jgi:hypothetical protein
MLSAALCAEDDGMTTGAPEAVDLTDWERQRYFEWCDTG